MRYHTPLGQMSNCDFSASLFVSKESSQKGLSNGATFKIATIALEKRFNGQKQYRGAE